jgi:MFS family permease
MTESSSPRGAWWLVVGVFLILMLSSGLGFYNLSVYLKVLGERGFSVSHVSAAIGVFFLVGGVIGPFIGRFLQRYDARWVIAFGALVGGAALLLLPRADSMLEIYLVYALFGVGYTSTSLIPATTLITRWFGPKQRAMALSITSTGLSVGGAVLTPLTVWLLGALALERVMSMIAALWCVGILVISLLLVRSWPAQVDSVGSRGSFDGVAYSEATRSRFFIASTVAFLLIMGTQVGGIAHLFNRGSEIAPDVTASMAVTTLAVMSVCGRFLGGVLVGRVPIIRFTVLNLIGQTAGIAIVGFAVDAVWLLSGAALFGFTIGNLLMLQPLILAEAFGVADYPRIYSMSQLVTMLGVAAGPAAMGIARELASYPLTFGAAAGLSGIALVILLMAGPLPRPLPGRH